MKKTLVNTVQYLKAPNMSFLKKLTTMTGVLQHTTYGIPDRNLGYALDDNARALVVAIEYYKIFKKKEWLDLAVTYISFLTHSRREDGFFNNFQRFDHRFIKDVSQDAFGEVVWALGVTIASKTRSDLTQAAKRLFGEIKGNLKKLTYARPKAYAILGLYELAKIEKNKEVLELISELSKQLVAQYLANKSIEWTWFENILNYGNYIIPAALFKSYEITKNKSFLDVAEESIEFLNMHSFTSQGIPAPIGSEGWMKKGEVKPEFDQQPVDAAYAVLANIAAFKATKEAEYLNSAKTWFSWFHGFNTQKVVVCDPKTGTCFDAVNRQGVNLNQGAESVICYLMAHLALIKTTESIDSTL